MILLQVLIVSLHYFCDWPDVVINWSSFTTDILLALLSNYNSLEFFKGKNSILFSWIEPENISATQFTRRPPMGCRRIHSCNSKEHLLICQLIKMVKVECSGDKHIKECNQCNNTIYPCTSSLARISRQLLGVSNDTYGKSWVLLTFELTM